ncbi:hypothetical protein ACIOJE_35160 [Kitasatospora sp. NPDC087861]|uniref:hypothetical protein n=1 Tax=Kitasatospora sp. NPDC087861 TaxID=3364070 RepID=UPI0038183045
MNADAYRLCSPAAAGLDLADLLISGQITAMSAGPEGWTATRTPGGTARPFTTPEHVRAYADHTRHQAAVTAQATADPEDRFLRRIAARAAEAAAATQRTA